jgi:hypothetical protein
MADTNDNTAGDGGNGDGRDGLVNIATSLYECRLLQEAANVALETLIGRAAPASPAELGVIQKLLRQAMDAAEDAQQRLFSLHGVGVGSA